MYNFCEWIPLCSAQSERCTLFEMNPFAFFPIYGPIRLANFIHLRCFHPPPVPYHFSDPNLCFGPNVLASTTGPYLPGPIFARSPTTTPPDHRPPRCHPTTDHRPPRCHLFQTNHSVVLQRTHVVLQSAMEKGYLLHHYITTSTCISLQSTTESHAPP